MQENSAEFTKKQEMEEGWKDHERTLSRLADNMLDMISEIDINGVRTYVSPSHKTVIGYEADFLKGRSVFEFTHPDDLERVKYEFNKGIKEQKPVKIEYRRIHADGHYIWVESIGNPVYSKDGKFIGGIITTRDITERKKYEKALEYRLAIEKLITSLATGFINVSTCDIDKEINKSLETLGKFMGSDRAYIWLVSDKGKSDIYEWHMEGQGAGLINGSSRELFTWIVNRLKSGEVLHISNLSEVPGEKEYFKVSKIHSLIAIPVITHNIFTGFLSFENFSSAKEWKEEDIRLLKLVAEIFVNILKRKESEEKLRKSEAHLSQTRRIAGLGSYESELPAGKLIWSEETFRITGMDPLKEEPSLDEYINMIHPEDRFTAKEITEKAIREKKSFNIEYRIILPDGSLKYIQSIGYPVINNKGTVSKIVGTIMNITGRKKEEEERKKIEERLRFVQKHESLGKMAGGIAHGFNNILASILGYTEITLMDLPPDSKVKTYIQQIEKSVYRGSEITKQMLSYTGHGKFILEPIEISKLIKEMYQFIQITISNKCIVEYVLEENLPYIEGDNAQIRQAIMNLIMNASEAMEDNNGIIILKTGKIICDRCYLRDNYHEENLSEGLYVYLDISDTGCGMTEDTVNKIFDPFFTTKFPGRGLGLASVHGILRAHKGAIKVFSKNGAGTTMRLLFPAQKSLQEQDLIKPDLQAKGKTILIIDDAEDICTIANNILQRVGFKVISAPDGREGLKMFRDSIEDISLVILDMIMPVMDGKKTFHELKRIKSDIPVIVTSGYNEEQAMKVMGVSNIAGFIQKPYKGHDLVELVKKIIKK